MMLWLLSFLFCTLAPALTFDINTTPICSVYTPHSILKNKEHFPILFVGGKPRYSTCTGAVWFHEHYLAVLNLYGQKINTYRFYAGDEHFEPLQEIDNAQGAQLTNPENLVVSRDGSLLATCLGGSDRGIRVYSIDTETHLIQPKPIVVIKTKNLIPSFQQVIFRLCGFAIQRIKHGRICDSSSRIKKSKTFSSV